MSAAATSLASLRLGANLVLAYRLEVVVHILSASLVTFFNWSLWHSVFVGRDTIAGRNAEEMCTYVVMAWVVTTFYSTRVDEFVGQRIRNGDIAIDLLRPWSLQLHLYMRELGRAGSTLLLTTVPLALTTVLVLPLRSPTRPSTWVALAISLLLAQAISFGLSWLVGLAAFKLRNAAGMARLKATLIGVFSGALIPLDLYPEPLRTIVALLPFQGLSHIPANIYVEHLEPGLLWQPLGIQLAWAIALMVLGALAFRSACRALVVQGG